MSLENQSAKEGLQALLGAFVVAVIGNRGVVAIIPDFILRDEYGDIRGIFGLPLAVGTVVLFGMAFRWICQMQGHDPD